jgi:integrin beta 1
LVSEVLVNILFYILFFSNLLTFHANIGDKNTIPYIIPGIEDNPCAPEKAECKPLYSYRHSLSLTKDVNEFIKKVNASEITGNLDTTEGGMDALMQILVCPEQIGWSNRSRKIVVFATDAKQHFAGDGRLAGIATLNDKQCHLNDVGEYTASLEFDYPSLEQIYRELVKMKVNIIFAVTKDLINHYNRMNDVMDDISSVGQLAMDSSNILQLVEHGYQEFARKATFLDNSADYIKMTYRTTCGGKYEEFVETSKCDNIEQGKDYEFYIDVTLLDYPDNNVYVSGCIIKFRIICYICFKF